jgi:hypothetical protein
MDRVGQSQPRALWKVGLRVALFRGLSGLALTTAHHLLGDWHCAGFGPDLILPPISQHRNTYVCMYPIMIEYPQQ